MYILPECEPEFKQKLIIIILIFKYDIIPHQRGVSFLFILNFLT